MNVARRSFARAFRWLWPRRFRDVWNYADFFAAALLFVFSLTISGLFTWSSGSPAPVLMLWFSLAPSFLLRAATVVRMTFFAVMGIPCAQAAYVLCDIGVDSDTLGILHATHYYLLLLIPYGILRAIVVALSNWNESDDLTEELKDIELEENANSN